MKTYHNDCLTLNTVYQSERKWVKSENMCGSFSLLVREKLCLLKETKGKGERVISQNNNNYLLNIVMCHAPY